MSKDFEGDYGDIVIRATKAGLNEVVFYLNRQARFLSKVRKENEELRNENNRLHARNEELGVYLNEQRERLKPDGPIMTKDAMLLAVQVLQDADVISWVDSDDWIDMINMIEKN